MDPTAKHYVLLGLAIVSAVATVLHNQAGGEVAIVGGAIAAFATSIVSLLTASPMLGAKATPK